MTAVRAEIVTWAEVRAGDRVLDDGEILTVERVETRGRVLDVRYAQPLRSVPSRYDDEWTVFPAAHLVARLLP